MKSLAKASAASEPGLCFEDSAAGLLSLSSRLEEKSETYFVFKQMLRICLHFSPNTTFRKITWN